MSQNLHVGSHKNSHPNYDDIRWFTPWFNNLYLVGAWENVKIDKDDPEKYRPYFDRGLTPMKTILELSEEREGK